MKDFGSNLKSLRKAKGLNQNELAAKLGTSKTNISNYETGYSNPPASTLKKIADFFDVTMDELFGKTIVAAPILNDPGLVVDRTPPHSVPVYASFSSSCSEKPLFQFTFSADFLGEGNFLAVKVNNHAMSHAGLADGSFAIVKRQNTVHNGELALVSVDDEAAFFCRFYQIGEFISLTFESGISAQPLMVDPQKQSINVVGKVVKVIHSVV
ncbi:MAG: helix-turn-helix domain-containing protein [Clostridia bacterium]|nr:helix-turn-helix domain-containing protein [Clostridia bacterium]